MKAHPSAGILWQDEWQKITKEILTCSHAHRGTLMHIHANKTHKCVAKLVWIFGLRWQGIVKRTPTQPKHTHTHTHTVEIRNQLQRMAERGSLPGDHASPQTWQDRGGVERMSLTDENAQKEEEECRGAIVVYYPTSQDNERITTQWSKARLGYI